jgi:NAD(P)-dependent dehydrogenase (short-subunit alcohol dehydrogenase family)
MTVCVAGTNKGLGLVLSKLIAEKGHTVYAGAIKSPAMNDGILDPSHIMGEFSPEFMQATKEFPGLLPLELDVTNENQAISAAKIIADSGAMLDAVVVTAGILPESDKKRPVTDIDIDDLRRTVDTNAVGSAVMIKHFHSLVKDGGIFILVSSEAGSMTNTGAGYPGYSVSKAAQNKLAAVFAKTVSRFRVLALHPGRMNTEMGRENAQIEPLEAATGIWQILNGEKNVRKDLWFVDYHGDAMEI